MADENTKQAKQKDTSNSSGKKKKAGSSNGNKSKGGMMSLVFALIALGLIVAAAIPMENIRGTGVMLSGWFNAAFAAGAFVFAIAAIVASAASKKGGKRSVPAKAGMITGILFIVLSLMMSMGTCTVSLLSDYANKGEESLLGKNVKDNAEKKERLDGFLDNILKDAGVNLSGTV